MDKLFEKCRGIIEECLTTASDADLQRLGIARFRERVKEEIKRRKLVDNSMNRELPKVYLL